LNALNLLSLRFQLSQKKQTAAGKKKISSEAGLARQNTAQTLIIGVGNEFRGDDAAGLAVSRRIAALKLPHIQVIELNGEGADLIEAWQGVESVYLIDAVSAQGLVGSVYLFDAQKQPLPVQYFGISSHAFGVAEAIEISRSLGQLPPKFVVYGIGCRNFDPGSNLSPEVRQAVENVIRQLLQEIEGL